MKVFLCLILLYGGVIFNVSNGKDLSKKPSKYRIVFIRHGESAWNEHDMFCGWCNCDLSERGRKQAIFSGQAIKRAGYKFDVGYTSALKRTYITLDLALRESGQEKIPFHKSWKLNGRHYGALTGMTTNSSIAMYGPEEKMPWFKSYDQTRPPLYPGHKYYKEIIGDKAYKDGPALKDFPLVESLKSSVERVAPYWNEVILAEIKKGKNVIVASHGSCIRGLIRQIEGLDDKSTLDFYIPTAIPMVYEFDEDMNVTVSRKYLADPAELKKNFERSISVRYAHNSVASILRNSLLNILAGNLLLLFIISFRNY